MRVGIGKEKCMATIVDAPLVDIWHSIRRSVLVCDVILYKEETSTIYYHFDINPKLLLLFL